MVEWQKIALAIISSGGLGAFLTALIRNRIEERKVKNESMLVGVEVQKADKDAEVSQFDLLTAKMADFTDRVTKRLNDCEARCAQCEVDHEQTRLKLFSNQQEMEVLRERVRVLEAE